MQVIGFLIAAFLLLWMIFGGSSDNEESSHQGQPDEPRRRHNDNYPLNPNYPPWGAPPDWQDWEYDYYRRPRAYGFRSVIAAYMNGIATIIAVVVLIFIIYRYSEHSAPITDKSLGSTTTSYVPEKQQVKKQHVQPYCLRSSRALDIITAQDVKAACPEVDFLLTSDKRYYAFISKSQNEGQALDQFSKKWRNTYREKFGFDFTFYPVHKLCTSDHESNIVHTDSPFIWVCSACMK